MEEGEKMLYYRITAKEEQSASQIIKTLKNSNTWARTNGNKLDIYACTGNDHTKHVAGIASQFNASVSQIAKEEIPSELTKQGYGLPKREYIAFDGTRFTDKMLYAQYERNHNPKNKHARLDRNADKPDAGIARQRKPRAPKADIVGRLEPNQPLTMQGVINSLSALEEKLLKAYEEISELRPKLEKIQEYEKLLQDRLDYMKSAKLILGSVS
jgi:hypothetical protein